MLDKCPVCGVVPEYRQGGYLACQNCGVAVDLENFFGWYPPHNAHLRWSSERLEHTLRACWEVNRTYMMDFRAGYPTFATYAEVHGLHVRPAKWAQVRKFWPTWPNRLPGTPAPTDLPF